MYLGAPTRASEHDVCFRYRVFCVVVEMTLAFWTHSAPHATHHTPRLSPTALYALLHALLSFILPQKSPGRQVPRASQADSSASFACKPVAQVLQPRKQRTLPRPLHLHPRPAAMSNFSSDRNALFAKSDAKAGKGAAPAVRPFTCSVSRLSHALPLLPLPLLVRPQPIHATRPLHAGVSGYAVHSLLTLNRCLRHQKA